MSAAPSAGGAAAVAEAPKEEEKKVRLITISFLLKCFGNVQSGVTIAFSINAIHVNVRNVSGGHGSCVFIVPLDKLGEFESGTGWELIQLHRVCRRSQRRRATMTWASACSTRVSLMSGIGSVYDDWTCPGCSFFNLGVLTTI